MANYKKHIRDRYLLVEGRYVGDSEVSRVLPGQDSHSGAANREFHALYRMGALTDGATVEDLAMPVPASEYEKNLYKKLHIDRHLLPRLQLKYGTVGKHVVPLPRKEDEDNIPQPYGPSLTLEGEHCVFTFDNFEYIAPVYIYPGDTEIVVIPEYGYEFTSWSDGNTDNPRTLTVAKEDPPIHLISTVTELAKYALNLSGDHCKFQVESNGEWVDYVAGMSFYPGSHQVRCIPDEGYRVYEWSSGETDTDVITINLTYPVDYTAYTIEQYTLSLTGPCKFFVDGVLYKDPIIVDKGDHTVFADCGENKRLLKWSDGLDDNPRTVFVNQNTSIAADVIGTATITLHPNVDCYFLVDGKAYSEPITVDFGLHNIQCITSDNHEFQMWSDGVIGNPRLINVQEDIEWTAIIPEVYPLTLIGDHCKFKVDGKSHVGTKKVTKGDHVVEVVADYGYAFQTWSDDNTDNPRVVTVSDDTVLQANCVVAYLVTLYGDHVHFTIDGHAYTAPTMEAEGTHVIEVTCDPGYLFHSWDDGITDNPRTIELTSNWIGSVTTDRAVLLTLNNLTTDPEAFQFTVDDVLYTEPMTVLAGAHILKVVPASNYRFDRWDDDTTANPRTVILAEDTVMGAYAIKVITITLGGPNCVLKVDNFPYTEPLTLDAGTHRIECVPNYSYEFIEWSDGVTDPVRVMDLQDDLELYAVVYQVCHLSISGDHCSFKVDGIAYESPVDVEVYAGPHVVDVVLDEGYVLQSWSDGSGRDNPREINVMSDLVLAVTTIQIPDAVCFTPLEPLRVVYSKGTHTDAMYSLDFGATWTPAVGTITVAKNQTLLLQGWQDGPSTAADHATISIFGKCNVSGNLNALNMVNKGTTEDPHWVYSDDLQDGAYIGLFENCLDIQSCEYLNFHSTTLTPNCYESMFENSGITVAPQLPATTLYDECYKNMFKDCVDLTSIPTLPATTLYPSCYYGMFSGTGVTDLSAYTLAAPILVESCYESMFENCSVLTKTPNLPADILAESCYRQMFKGCTSLTDTGTLTAETLVTNCYAGMFFDCENLNKAHILCNEDYVNSTYVANMFYGVADEGTLTADGDFKWHDYASLPIGWFIIPIHCYITLTGSHMNFTVDGLPYTDPVLVDYHSTHAITCAPDNGYRFDVWSDGSTERARRLYIEGSIELVSNAIKIWTLTLLGDHCSFKVDGVPYASPLTVDQGKEYEILCTPDVHYRFEEWDDDVTTPLRIIVPNDDVTLTATTIKVVKFVLQSSPANLCTFRIDGIEYTSFDPFPPVLDAGYHTITAEPIGTDEYRFVRWSLDSLEFNPLYYDFQDDIVLTAYMTKIWKLTLLPNNCTYKVDNEVFDPLEQYLDAGSHIIQCIPDPQYEYIEWSDGVKRNPRSIDLTSDLELGTTIYHYATIHCDGSNCSFKINNVVYTAPLKVYDGEYTIQCIPDNGYRFDKWDDDVLDNPRTLTVNTSTEPDVYFHSLAVKIATLTLNSDYCTFQYSIDEGTTWIDYTEPVVLDACTLMTRAFIPEGYRFNAWSDGRVENPRTDDLWDDLTLFASVVKQWTLDLIAVDHVTYYVDNIPYVEASLVLDAGKHVVRAVPDTAPEYDFICWNDLNTDNPRNLNLTRDWTLSAVVYPVYTITCIGPNCLFTVDGIPYVLPVKVYADVPHTIVCAPGDGYIFNKWSDDEHANPRVVEIDADTTFEAIVSVVPTDPLCFTAITDTQVTYIPSATAHDTQYTLGDPTDPTTVWLPADNITITVPAGQKAYFRGNLYNQQSQAQYAHFNTEGTFDISGSINSLTNNQYSLYDYAFYKLFAGCEGLRNASDLRLNSMNLKNYCYAHMFDGCTSLTSAPALPAVDISLANHCYDSMFNKCYDLLSVPTIGASFMSTGACYAMFKDCTSIVEVASSGLPALELAPECYDEMFSGCVSLNKAPELPAPVLAERCYRRMFQGCTALTETPDLVSENTALDCYREMFKNCSNLNLAYVAAEYTYNAMIDMFDGVYPTGTLYGEGKEEDWKSFPKVPEGWFYYKYKCTLTLIPQAGVTYFVDDKQYVTPLTFRGNTTHKLYAAASDSEHYVYIWLDGVKTKERMWTALDDWETGVVIEPVPEWISFTNPAPTLLKALKAAPNAAATVKVYDSTVSTTEWSSDKETWEPFTDTITINSGETIYVRGILTGVQSATDYRHFETTGNLVLGGCINSMNNNSVVIPSYGYYGLFSGTSITDASEFLMPTKSVSSYCYYSLFGNCTSLTKAPMDVPMTTVQEGSCAFMFTNCTALTTTPVILANNLQGNYCYQGMFSNCPLITSAPGLPAILLTEGCYANMFQGCTSLAVAPELPAPSIRKNCYAFMFSGCTSLVEAPELPAKFYEEGAYTSMFDGCTNLCYANIALVSADDIMTSTHICEMFKDVAEEGVLIADGSRVNWCDVTSTHPCVPTTWWVNGLTITANAASSVNLTSTTTAQYFSIPDRSWTDLTHIMALGVNESLYLRSESVNNESRHFDITGNVRVHGELESFYTDNTTDVNMSLFKDNSAVESIDGLIIDTATASSLVYMFENCTGLVNGAAYISGAGNVSCACMFRGCTSLVNAPYINAHVVYQSFQDTFRNCTSLTDVSNIHISNGAVQGCAFMFSGCKALEYGPTIPANSAMSSYSYMFDGCLSLKGMIHSDGSLGEFVLPATELFRGDYSYMFRRCSSLETVPKLPATQLADNCYNCMFYGCTSLTGNPVLPATTTAPGCYTSMFGSCSNINRAFVACKLDAISGFTNMFSDVAPVGTLVALGTKTDWTSVPKLPEGWFVEIPTLYSYNAGSTAQVTYTPSSVSELIYSLDAGATWLEYTAPITQEGLVLFKETLSGNQTASDYAHLTFTSTSNFIGGNIKEFCTSGASYTYAHLLEGADADVSQVVLPDGQYAEGAFCRMFKDCTTVDTPILPVPVSYNTALFSGMFYNCDNITIAPELPVPSGTVSGDCYKEMFFDCDALEAASCYFPASIITSANAMNMWESCNPDCEYMCADGTEQAWLDINTPITWFRSLTITATEASTVYLNVVGSPTYTMKYSLNGSDEQAMPTSSASAITMAAGDKLVLSGTITSKSASDYTTITGTGKWNVSGRLASLNDFAATTPAHAYAHVFAGAPVVSVSEMSVGGMAVGAYMNAFNGCTQLTSTPVLPSTTLSSDCYSGMFAGCTALTISPDLSATTAADRCYYKMFDGCSSLNNIGDFALTTLAEEACRYTWRGTAIKKFDFSQITTNALLGLSEACSVSQVEELILPTIATDYGCYNSICWDCVSLTKVTFGNVVDPTELSFNCAFKGCTSLSNVTGSFYGTFGTESLRRTFEGTAITDTPKITITGIETDSTDHLYHTFYNASNLSYATILVDESLYDSVGFVDAFHGVNPTGFLTYKGGDQERWMATPAVPEGWFNYLHLHPTSASTVYLTVEGTPAYTMQYTKDGKTWSDVPTSSASAVSFAPDEIVWLKGTRGTITSSTDRTFIKGSGSYDVQGKLSALNNGATTCGTYAFKSLFEDNAALTSSRLLSLDMTSVGEFAYSRMFYHCNNMATTVATIPLTTIPRQACYEMFADCYTLTTAPTLPATTVGEAGYCYMFQSCIALTTAPTLPATTLGTYSYSCMFNGCESLTSAPALPATTVASYTYERMFMNCTAIVNPPALPATTLGTYCYQSMFNGCTALEYVPNLPATNLQQYCYYSMFDGCSSLIGAEKRIAVRTDHKWEVCLSKNPASGTYRCYRSISNYHTASGISDLYIDVYGWTGNFTIYIRSYGESNCDYAIAYNLDIDGTSVHGASDIAADTYGKSTSATAIANYTAVTYSIPDTGHHFIKVRYRKDGSTNTGEDRGYLCIPRSNFWTLPAATTQRYCYNGMFRDCTSLTDTPYLVSNFPEVGAYVNMFLGCNSLERAYTDTNIGFNTANHGSMFLNVPSTGDLQYASGSKATWMGTTSIPEGWFHVAPLTLTAVSNVTYKVDNDVTVTSESAKDYYIGTHTIQAVPATNYKFVKWSDGNTTNPRDISLAAAGGTYTAVVELATVALTINPYTTTSHGLTSSYTVDGVSYTLGTAAMVTPNVEHTVVVTAANSGNYVELNGTTNKGSRTMNVTITTATSYTATCKCPLYGRVYNGTDCSTTTGCTIYVDGSSISKYKGGTTTVSKYVIYNTSHTFAVAVSSGYTRSTSPWFNYGKTGDNNGGSYVYDVDTSSGSSYTTSATITAPTWVYGSVRVAVTYYYYKINDTTGGLSYYTVNGSGSYSFGTQYSTTSSSSITVVVYTSDSGNRVYKGGSTGVGSYSFTLTPSTSVTSVDCKCQCPIYMRNYDYTTDKFITGGSTCTVDGTSYTVYSQTSTTVGKWVDYGSSHTFGGTAKSGYKKCTTSYYHLTGLKSSSMSTSGWFRDDGDSVTSSAVCGPCWYTVLVESAVTYYYIKILFTAKDFSGYGAQYYISDQYGNQTVLSNTSSQTEMTWGVILKMQSNKSRKLTIKNNAGHSQTLWYGTSTSTSSLTKTTIAYGNSVTMGSVTPTSSSSTTSYCIALNDNRSSPEFAWNQDKEYDEWTL